MSTQRTIPSAVLGEYLSDLYRFESATKITLPEVRTERLAPCKKWGQGLAPYLAALWGEEIAYDYWDVLAKRAEAQRRNRRPSNPFRRREPPKATAPIVEKPKPKPKLKRTDAAYNERRMRNALLEVVRPSGWVKVGIRELGRRAGNMAHRTARDTLARMAQDGQVELDAHWGQGKRTGVHPLLNHPAWSEHETAQLARKS